MVSTNRILAALAIVADLFLSRWVGHQALGWMPSQGTAEAKQVDDLFSFLVSIGTFIFAGLAGMVLYSIIFDRAAKGDWSDGKPIREDWRLETAWTAVPLFLVLWISAQSFRIYEQLNLQGLTPIVHLHLFTKPVYAQNKPTEQNPYQKPAAEEVEVIAKQWSWSFRYPGSKVTSTELHLPVNESVRVKLESLDVLHGFYVPEFRVKQDIIPNRAITFTFTPIREGKYRLRDSQFSGTYFAVMDADVIVESPAAYRKWLAQGATRIPTAAKNSAFAEYSQQVKSGRKGWATVPPAAPPVVNYSP